ncbi:hypothetical protein Patl1_21059 [Pistacia atlantica]|uniref:Uncharacterized protein n=1 Tax=Pistacia atlantica TaxID=434234 RepID=A0ACC1BKB0_9ROSI|nr:hypothetical protein Patl1_21059 [Pistacia atlantica]
MADRLATGYFAFLEVTLNNHLSFILNQDTNSFIYIIRSLEAGLKSVNTNIISQCASSIDNLATFYFIHIITGDSPTSPAALNLAKHISDCPGLFPNMFTNTKAQILASQPMNQQQHLSLCFDKLMTDVTQSLDPKNRDKFSQNLTRLRNEFRAK